MSSLILRVLRTLKKGSTHEVSEDCFRKRTEKAGLRCRYCLLFEPRNGWEWVKGDVPLVGWCFWQQYNRCCKKGNSLKMKISYRLAFVQNCNVDREVWAHPKTSWLNCRCCAKPSGKSKYFTTSKQFWQLPYIWCV